MTPIDEWSFTRGTFLKGTGVLAVGFSASGVLARGAAAAGAKAGVGVPWPLVHLADLAEHRPVGVHLEDESTAVRSNSG